MNPSDESIHRAAAAVAAAEALVICAGAGMGVDSGLPAFRGNEGFWQAYPPAAKLGLSFADLANPACFDRDPARAWGFYGHRYELYRATAPHAGFAILHQWADRMPRGCFVFTSNVDGQFQKAGFTEDGMVECHGSLQHQQCVKPCCAATWPTPEGTQFTVDPATLQAQDELPRCPMCGGLARPNVLMFGDGAWNPGRTAAQQIKFRLWLRRLARGKLLVVEAGAGTAIPTVRQTAEQLAEAAGTPLIRINPHEAYGPPGTISLAENAYTALTKIDEQLRILNSAP
ncbi:MAG TPA: Sir2 family NAD-dependent protein deacetylase [Opitutaceae bacterium]|nr:Sir2 family NAD-dependent protein deacetylase [Opitutaceae bacterium]